MYPAYINLQTANQHGPHLMLISCFENCHKHVIFRMAKLFEIYVRYIIFT